jgi:hypothetical protein
MDERLLIFCWAAGGGVFLGGVGALFGGLAGYMARLHGRSPGSFVGWRVLRAVERALHRELTPLRAGILIGAFDGASFLGLIGVLLGLLAGKAAWLSPAALVTIFLGVAIVAVLAVALGLAAYAFSRAGIVVFGTASAGGLVGVFIAALIAGPASILAGAWIGLLLGFGVGWLGGRRPAGRGRSKKIRIDFEEPEP